jgi:hypothetical protein
VTWPEQGNYARTVVIGDPRDGEGTAVCNHSVHETVADCIERLPPLVEGRAVKSFPVNELRGRLLGRPCWLASCSHSLGRERSFRKRCCTEPLALKSDDSLLIASIACAIDSERV